MKMKKIRRILCFVLLLAMMIAPSGEVFASLSPESETPAAVAESPDFYEEPAAEAVEETVEELAEAPAEEPIEAPAEEPVEEPVEETEEPAAETAEPVEEPAEETAAPAEEPVEETEASLEDEDTDPALDAASDYRIINWSYTIVLDGAEGTGSDSKWDVLWSWVDYVWTSLSGRRSTGTTTIRISGKAPRGSTAQARVIAVADDSDYKEMALLAYEITILDPNGEVYEPATPLKVSIVSNEIKSVLGDGDSVVIYREVESGKENPEPEDRMARVTCEVSGSTAKFQLGEFPAHILVARRLKERTIFHNTVTATATTVTTVTPEEPPAEGGEPDETPAPAVTETVETQVESTVALSGSVPAEVTASVVPVAAAEISDSIDIAENETVIAYDVTLYRESETFQPAVDNPVTVSITSPVITEAEEKGAGIEVWHIADDGTAERMSIVSVSDGTVTFEAKRFSVYVIRTIVLEKTLIASDGNTYRITVEYDTESGIPADASLYVSELAPGADGYDEYVSETLAALGMSADEVGSVRPFDISIESPTAGHIRPTKDVKVSVRLLDTEVEDDADYSVVHFGDETEQIANTVADGAIEFTTRSFSIYVIVDGETGGNARIGYRFWYPDSEGKYQEITTQYFRYADVQAQGMKIYEPGIPGISQSELVTIFEGWHKGTVTTDNASLETASVTVAQLNAELQAMADTDYVEGTIIDVIAKLKTAYYITYVDVNPSSILSTDLAVKAESGDTTFVVKEGIRPTRYEDDLKGWRLLEDIADDTATLYKGGLAYTITENITLAPVIEGGYWLVFDDNDLVDDGTGKMVSGGASYTPPAFYMNNASQQDATVQPPDPEWTGYEFGGWYEDAACTTPFTFGETLSQNTTVHAKWIPSGSSYTVIIWKQPTDPNAENYDFDRSYIIGLNAQNEPDGSVKTGDLVYLNSSYTQIYGEDGTSTDLDKQYFTYNQEKTDQYIIVKANGSSVLNVYYDRVPMTITFYTWGRGDGYVYTETTADTGTQYGIVDGEYVLLSHDDAAEDIYSYAYSPAYVTAPANLSATYTQYGIIDGEYQQLDRQPSYSFTYAPFNTTTGNTGTQYALVDGEYVPLTRVDNTTTYSWTPSYTFTQADPTSTTTTYYGVVDGAYVQLTYNRSDYYATINGVNTAVPDSTTRYVVSTDTNNQTTYGIVNGALVQLTRAGNQGNRYWTYNGERYNGTRYRVSTNDNNTYVFVNGQMLPVTYDRTYYWYSWSYNGTVYHSVQGSTGYYGNTITVQQSTGDTCYTRANYTGAALADGTTRYKLVNGSYEVATDNEGTQYYFDGTGYVQLTRSGTTTYAWQYTRDGVTVTLSDSDTRYIQSGNATTYTGTRYTRDGSDWWEYSYGSTDAQTTGLYGVDNRGGHVALNRSTNPDSYTYSYDGTEYTGTRYYAPNNNPVSYTGTVYTLDNGVYHVTTEGSTTEPRYGQDSNGVFRLLTATVTHPQVWSYEKTVDGVTVKVPYTGTRYTRTATTGNSWQLYKQFVGVYGATLEQYGYEWPMEKVWYDTGYNVANGGNANNGTAGRTGGSRMTLKTTFEPLEGDLNPKYFSTTDSSTSSYYISFLKQNLDGSYTEADRIYSTSGGSFSINDKYTGFHASQYRVDSGTWRNVSAKDSEGYYNRSVSYSRTIEIRFDRNDYQLVFFPDPDTNAAPITYDVLYGRDLSTYASQSPGQKNGHYFLGWYADDAHTTSFNFNQTMPDHNVSVFGYWRMERTRVVFVPGADNVYIDPGQAMTFRLDYDEKIGGALLEAATRTGYTLDGWYTDPNFTNRFLFSTPVNSNTEGVDMTYQTAARWTSARESYGDNTEKNSNVRGILILYAKWIVNTSEKGVNLVYDAGTAALYDGVGNLTTTVPVDQRLYQDGSSVVVGAAPSDYSELYYFDYWEIVDSDGNPLEVDGVTAFYPGTTFNVDHISNDDAFALIKDENDEVVIKTIKLRAHYTISEEAAARYTMITYDGNTLEGSIYPSGTEELHGKARDGSQRVTITLDTEINTTITLKNEEDFYLDGYTLVGWSFFQGTYDEQVAAANDWNTEHPDDPVVVRFAPSQHVAADGLKKNDVNGTRNTLYAMWQPKTYTVTVKQVVEDGVAAVHNNSETFTYSYKSNRENAMTTTTSSLTLTGSDSVTYTNLTQAATVPYQYYGRLGHVFNITPPSIPSSAEYAVRVSATVLRDDGTLEALTPNSLGNYEILGDVEITFTYSLKVPVTLEKRALNNDALLTGSRFVLTPVQWNAETQRWDAIGTDTFPFDMSSASSLTIRLQEGIYRVEETQAPTDYARMGEPLLLTVQKNSAFTVRTTTSGAVSANVAKITGTDSHTLTIYDRPIRTVTIEKIVKGDDFEPTGYTFSVQLSLEGSYLRGYDTVGSGLPADTTNSNGIIECKVKNGESKTLSIPWGAVVRIEERAYDQYTVETKAVKTGTTTAVANAFTGENDDKRVYEFTLDANTDVTYTNVKRMPAPTEFRTTVKPYYWLMLLGLAALALPTALMVVKRRREDERIDELPASGPAPEPARYSAKRAMENDDLPAAEPAQAPSRYYTVRAMSGPKKVGSAPDPSRYYTKRAMGKKTGGDRV